MPTRDEPVDRYEVMRVLRNTFYDGYLTHDELDRLEVQADAVLALFAAEPGVAPGKPAPAGHPIEWCGNTCGKTHEPSPGVAVPEPDEQQRAGLRRCEHGGTKARSCCVSGSPRGPGAAMSNDETIMVCGACHEGDCGDCINIVDDEGGCADNGCECDFADCLGHPGPVALEGDEQ